MSSAIKTCKGGLVYQEGGLYLEGKYVSIDSHLLSEDGKHKFYSALDVTGSGSFAFSAQWRNDLMQAISI